jgi:hypothetical protein
LDERLQKTPEDWTKVKVSDIIARNGKGLVYKYGGSLIRALQAIYPGIPVSSSKPQNIKEPGYWNSIENQRQFFADIGKKLSIHTDK